jgi:flagellar hook-associated protein 3 FlgL
MRIPYDVVRDGLTAINQAAENMSAAQRQVSTGRRLNGAGDDPLAAQQAVATRAELGAVDAYSRTVDAAASRLASADSILSSFGDKLGAVIVAGLSAKGSTATPDARSAAAAAVSSLRDALLSDINTTVDGRAVFSGTQSNAVAYAQVGGAWTYQGNANALQVEVEHGRLVSVTFDGSAIAQGGDATDVFTVLDGLVSAINAGDDTGISTAVAAVERAFDRTLRAQGRLGADERGLDDATVRLATLRRAGEGRRAALEDANMAEAVTRLTAADTSYRAALASVSTVERVSLLDYLR